MIYIFHYPLFSNVCLPAYLEKLFPTPCAPHQSYAFVSLIAYLDEHLMNEAHKNDAHDLHSTPRNGTYGVGYNFSYTYIKLLSSLSKARYGIDTYLCNNLTVGIWIVIFDASRQILVWVLHGRSLCLSKL